MTDTLTVAGLINRLVDLPLDAEVCAVGEIDDGSGRVNLVWPGSVDFDGEFAVLRDGYSDVREVKP